MNNLFKAASLSAAIAMAMFVSCTPKADKFEMLIGGDISELTYVEQNGGKYYENGVEKDCIKILSDNGCNIVRLRLYNDPGNREFFPSRLLPKGIEDEADILSLAKRSKDAGMKIQLSFHYSDSWTNGRDQHKPHEWEGLDFEQLKQALYDYTFNVMTAMKAQGTSPEYVSLGNETQSGMLYPDGSAEDMEKLCQLYNAGAKAVRDVDPESKIIIHLADGGKFDLYKEHMDAMKLYNVDYDIIGTSYYPFWCKIDVATFMEFADQVLQAYPDKDMIIMETGYSWNPTLPDGKPGQLRDNGPYDDMTPAGQKAFMKEMVDAIDNYPSHRILGFLYWDPVFIEVEGLGFVLGADNVVSNTTLFDFEGNALEVFDAFKR